MFGFLQNLGIGKKTPAPTPTMTAESVGAVGPGMMDMTEASGIGYDSMDPRFGAVGVADGYEYDPVQGMRKKRPGWQKRLGKAAGRLDSVGASLAGGVDVTQGMPAQQPFRLTGGLMGRY